MLSGPTHKLRGASDTQSSRKKTQRWQLHSQLSRLHVAGSDVSAASVKDISNKSCCFFLVTKSLFFAFHCLPV